MFFFRDCREHGPPYGRRRCHPWLSLSLACCCHFFNPCTLETSVYPCRSCLLISLLTLMYVCALALLNRSCCIRWSIVSYTKVLILKFCNVQFRFNFIPPHFEWTTCVLFKRSHVKFIGIVRAWRKDSIFDSFFQRSELLPATPTHMEHLNLAVQN